VVPPNKHVPEDDQWLFKYYDIGFVNFVERPTRAQKNIYPREFIKGAQRIKEIVAKYTPKVVCFIGTSIYKHFQSGLPERDSYGPQRNYLFENHGVWNGCLVFVIPSTSAKARGYSLEIKKE
jgi:TDG/mug DNA glycosylase family protein